MKLLRYIFTSFLLGLTFFSTAQNILNVNGTVTGANGMPVINCPIDIKGDSLAIFIDTIVYTTSTGQYSIDFNINQAIKGFLNIHIKDSCIVEESIHPAYFDFNINAPSGPIVKDFTLCPTGCSATLTAEDGFYPGTTFIRAQLQGVYPIQSTWDMGDGTQVHNDDGFTYTYSDSADYIITLTTTDALGCISNFTDTFVNHLDNNIQLDVVTDTLVNPDLTLYHDLRILATASGGTAPYQHILTYEVEFGTNSINPALSNPAIYTPPVYKSGTTRTCALVRDALGGEMVNCRDIYMKYDSCIANMQYQPTNLSQPNTTSYYFDAYPLGTAPFTYSWDFGDGTNSTQRKDHHAYTAPGLYNVCLTVTDSAGYISTECDAIVIQGSIAPCTAGFSTTLVGDSLFVSADVPQGLAPFTYSWNFGDGTIDTLSTLSNVTHQYGTVGTYEICLTVGDSLGCTATYCEFIDIFYNQIEGNIYFDANQNCINDNELLLGNTLIQIVNMLTSDTTVINIPIDTTFDIANNAGDFILNLNNGTYEISAVPLSLYWQACTPQIFTLTGTDTILTDLGLQSITPCSHLSVALSSPNLVYCYDNSYQVNYCNKGTQDESNVYVEVELDPFLVVNTTSIPYTQNGNIYTFQIGDLTVNECGSFKIDFTVDCNADLGQIHCTEAHIYPDQICLPNGMNWNGANVRVDATCIQNDSIQFTIENIGNTDMTQPRQYYVVEDQVLPIQRTFQLQAGQDTSWTIPATPGVIYFLQAEQEISYPLGNNLPTAVVYNCNSSSNFPNLINQFSLGDGFSFSDVDCQQNLYSFDPNDKQAFPVGYDDNMHYIKKEDKIEYLIRFQNTGTFTAFNVRVEDEIDTEVLDLSTLQIQGASHAYEVSILEGNTLSFNFPNIMLPDSNANEPLSHGFIKFKIAQKVNNPIGTIIENDAAIYFDFNEPIITNTTFHTVGENFIIATSTYSKKEKLANVTIAPNPFTTQAIFEVETEKQFTQLRLTIFDVMGREVQTVQSNSNQIILPRNKLIQGIYFYRIEGDGQVLDTGKLIVQ